MSGASLGGRFGGVALCSSPLLIGGLDGCQFTLVVTTKSDCIERDPSGHRPTATPGPDALVHLTR